MRTGFGVNILIWIIIGGAGLYFLANRIINSNAIPTLEEVISQNKIELEGEIDYLPIQAGSSTIMTRIARSEEDRNRGLSGIKSLRDNEGMLFIFASSTKPGFWMKDMNFPIDIVWINKDKEVVGIENNVSTSTFPKVFYPKLNILYVLEINANESQKLNIKVNSKLEFCVDNCDSGAKKY